MGKYNIGELTWKITGDESGLVKSSKKADKKMEETGKKATSVGSIIKTAFAVIATLGIVKFVKSLIRAGSDAEETAQKFSIVFKGMGNEAQAAADLLTKSYGLSRVESQKMLADTADLVNGFGIVGKQALDLSLKVQTLAVDLASFSNIEGGAARASRALTKALLGERESVKELGISIQEKDVVEQVAVNRAKGVTFETERAAKAFATLEIASRQSKNAIGDFGRSINSFANQQRIARARADDLKVAMAKNLIPIAALALKAFNEMTVATIKSVKSMNDWITSARGARIISSILGTIAGWFSALKVLISPVFDAFKKGLAAVLKPLEDLGDTSAITDAVLSGLAITAKLLAGALVIVGTVIGAIITTIIKFVKNMSLLGESFSNVISLAKKEISTEEYLKRSKKLKDEADKNNQEIGDSWKRVGSVIKNTVMNFEKDSDKLAANASKTFAKVKKDVSNVIFDTLTKQKKANKDAKKGVKDAKDGVDNLTKSLTKGAKAWKDLSTAGKLQAVSSGVQSVTSQITNLLQSVNNLSNALGQQRLAALDEQMQAELEAAGVAEESAVARAERELAEAQTKGDTELARQKQQELKKAKIEDKFRKKKLQAEYEIALTSWEFQKAIAIIQGIQAPLNAFVSGLKVPPPATIPVATAMAAIAAGAAAVQVAAIMASKPQPPKFEMGGIVPGGSTTADSVTASLTPGEEVLSRNNPRHIANMGSQPIKVTVNIGPEQLFEMMYEASRSGELIIDSRGVVE